MQTTITQFIRDEKNRPCGVMYAENIDGVVNIGFSLCRRKSKNNPGDEYSKEFGIDLAKKRAISYVNRTDSTWPDKMVSVRQIRHEKHARIEKFKAMGLIVPENAKVVILPQSIVRDLANFVNRCKRYYKNATLPKWTEKVVGVVKIENERI